jgi:outer membrane protein OmpA-like peptidoglycan-associated protein
MAALATCVRRQLAHALFGIVGLALLVATPVAGQEVASPATAPSGSVAGEAASARELQAAIDAIKRRVAEQQEGREGSGTSELVAELRSARQAIAELTQNLGRLRGERDALQSELTAKQRLESELRAALDERLEREAALEDALAALKEQALADKATHETALADSRAQATADATRAAEIETALAGVERDLETMRAELARTVEQREAALASGRKETERLAAEVAGLEDALAAARADADGVAAELGETQAALETRESELATAEASRTGLANQLAAATANQATLQRQLGEAEATIAGNDQEIAELRQVASRSVAEVEELGETLLVTLAENETLVAALAEARDSRTLIEAELRAMRREMEAYGSAAASDEFEADGAGVPLALVSSDAVIEAIDAELLAARRQIAALNEELIARDKQLATAGADGDADALNQQVGLLRRQVEALEIENATLLDNLAQLEALAAPEVITASLAPDEAVEHYLGQLNAVDTGDGWWLTVPEGLVFAPGSDELAPGTEPVVAQIAALLGYFGDAEVRIVGHTDSFGDAAVNKELSLQRAETVGRMLVDSFGIQPDRIATEGFGEEQPIASNATIEGRRANRRVEVYIQR